jgi:hypothetical protein
MKRKAVALILSFQEKRKESEIDPDEEVEEWPDEVDEHGES